MRNFSKKIIKVFAYYKKRALLCVAFLSSFKNGSPDVDEKMK